MQAPMVGTWDVQLHQVRPFTIHGDLYYEVHVTRRDDPVPQMVALRIPQHVLPQTPLPNEAYRITFLMGQVTAAQKITWHPQNSYKTEKFVTNLAMRGHYNVALARSRENADRRRYD